MPTDIERLQVSIEANLKQYERELARAQRTTVGALRKIEKDAQASAVRVEKRFQAMGAGIGRALKGALAGVTVIGAARAIGNVVDELAELGEIAERIGVPVESLQAIQRAAIVTGASVEETNKALQSIAEQAATSGSALEKTFAASGRSLRDAQGNLRPMIDIFRDFSDILQQAGSQQERLAILTRVTGDRVGRELVEAFSKGGAAIDATLKDMAERGILHSQAQIAEAAKIRDAYKDFTDQIARYWQSMVVRLIQSTGLFETNQIAVLQRQLRARQALLQEAITAGSGAGLAGGLNAVPGASILGQAYGIFGQQRAGTLAAEVAAIQRSIEELQELQRELARGQALSRTQGLISALPGTGTGTGAGKTADRLAAVPGLPVSLLQPMAKQIEELPEALDMAREAFSGFLTQLRSGVSIADAFTAALDRLANRAISSAVDTLFDLLPGLFRSFTAPTFSSPLSLGYELHRGGVAGRDGVPRLLPASTWSGARRMHSGGLVGGEVPTILQRGEMVIPRGAMGRGGGQQIVNVYPQPGQSVERRERQSNGRQIVDIVLGEVKRDFAQGGFDKAAARYGMRPVTGRR